MPESTPQPSLRATGWQQVAVASLIGIALGWFGFSGADRFVGSLPVISIQVPLVIAVLALIAAVQAWRTHRSVQVHQVVLPPRRALARLIFAKACLLGGSFLAGTYAAVTGYLLRRLALDLPAQSLFEPVAALVAALGLAIAGGLGQRACRIRTSSPAATPKTMPGSRDSAG